MNRPPSSLVAVVGLVAFAFVGLATAQAQRKPRPAPRAAKPTFNEREVSRIFFNDVFAEGLEGERPANLSASPMIASGGPAAGAVAGAESPGGYSGDWKSFLPASVIEDELKAIKLKVDADVTTPSKWNGGGYEECRRHFSIAAAMFGIISEYDGDVRWKKEAPYLRDVFARSAANAKVGTPQSYNEAKLRKQDLTDLVGGATIAITGTPEPKTDWGATVDRAPIMQRIDMGQQEKLNAAVANEAAFKSNKEDLLHEAAMFAALAQILKQETMPDGTDESYVEFCDELLNGSTMILDAIKLDSYDQANKGSVMINTSCTNCHDLYRNN